MNPPLTNTAWIIITLLVFSCKKSSQSVDDNNLTGKWTWIQTSNNNMTTTGKSGIYKNVIFGMYDSITITHNDSNEALDLNVLYIALLKDTIERGVYQIQNIGCTGSGIPALITDVPYQYEISGDTLYLANLPCLAQISTTYVRAQ